MIRRLVRYTVAGLLLASAAKAQVPVGPPVQSAPYAYAPLGYQQMASLASATFLPNIPASAIYAFVVCSGQAVFWRDDGVAPTTTVGNPLPVNTQIIFSTKPLSAVQIIQAVASATCNVEYYR